MTNCAHIHFVSYMQNNPVCFCLLSKTKRDNKLIIFGTELLLWTNRTNFYHLARKISGMATAYWADGNSKQYVCYAITVIAIVKCRDEDMGHTCTKHVDIDYFGLNDS